MKFNIDAKLLFCTALIFVSILPIVTVWLSYKFPVNFGSLELVTTLAIVGSTHVFGTTYLFTDKTNIRFVLSNPIKLIIVPLLLICLGIILIGNPNNNLFIPAAMLYLIYTMWHFGAQNIGVASFISISTRQKSISSYQKKLLQLCAITAMFGVLKIRQPDLGSNSFIPFMKLSDTVLSIINILYNVGTYMAILLTILVFISILPSLLKREYVHCISMMICATFLFTMFFTLDRMLGYGAFATAHGLQYLIFLSTHSIYKNKSKNIYPLKKILPFFVMVSILILAGYIWLNFHVADNMNENLPFLGMGVIYGLTLSHYWVDQYFWTMKNPDRRIWIKDRFNFIFTNSK